MELYKDIIKAPHTLIAGTTGSGKSVCLNGIIRQLLTDNTPNTAEFIVIDPKRIELSKYKNIAKAYIRESADVPGILDEVIAEVERRYIVMESEGVTDYDGKALYIIIDELADLMISPQNKQIKLKLQKILQIARAAKVHVIAATQAPNRQIIPANLVLNFTNRVALRCLSSIESRQIINQAGAENLPQYGQGLYLSPKGISTVTIPLTPDNKDIIATWEVQKPKAVEKPKAIEEEIIYIPVERYERKQPKADPGIIFRNIAFALAACGVLIGTFA